MHHYAAYGLTIRSAFELPELPERSVGESERSADVVFRRGELEPVSPAADVDDADGRRTAVESGRCRFTYDGIGTFLVEGGERVTFDPADATVVETPVVRRLFENEMLGVLSHQRGRLVLHASAVSVDGRGALFVGPSGVGKSTTAAAVHAGGHALLEDDVVVLRFDDDGPTVLPGVPQLRLVADAADALGVEPDADAAGDDHLRKVHRRLDERPAAVPLQRCYFLRQGDALAVSPLDAREALFGLVSRTYTRGMLEDTGRTGENFEQCSAVVESTAVRELCRPDDHDRLPDLVDLIVEDLGTDEAPVV